MSYRPITDTWILARSKTKDDTGKTYHGAYLSGFLERARPILVGNDKYASILHVCGGMARNYNGNPKEKGGITLTGFGKNDLTLDIDPLCKPDILADARNLSKAILKRNYLYIPFSLTLDKIKAPQAIIIDRPYTIEDAKNYRCGSDVLPNINTLLTDCLKLTNGFVGVIDYIWPSTRIGKEVYVFAVGSGRNGRARWFTVWKRNNKTL
jgi:hypothetical protein